MRRLLGYTIPVLIVAALAASAYAAGTLIVLNKSDHEAALVNPETFTVTARVPTGKGPHEAAVSPDGRLA
ncbi:MAG: YncE family protein, partial [Candidatus Acidiferrales bacterium]